MEETITFPARVLAGLIESLHGGFAGPRTVMVAYKLGQTLKALTELNAALLERLQPFIANGALRTDLSEKEAAELEVILGEDLEVAIIPLTIQELDACGLQVTDPFLVPFLVTHGVLRPAN